MTAEPTLFDDVAAQDAHAAKMHAFRAWVELDCCTGYTEPCPPDERGHIRVRCGRCGTLVLRYALVTDHDCGYAGCHGGTDPLANDGRDALGNDLGEATSGRLRRPMDVVALSTLRHDRLHWPDCARCGHAWGIHTGTMLGTALPEETSCYAYCGCSGYLTECDQRRTA